MKEIETERERKRAREQERQRETERERELTIKNPEQRRVAHLVYYNIVLKLKRLILHD
jgi:hypothetical protein